MPRVTTRGSIRVEGLDDLLDDLSWNKPIYAQPWKRALTKAVQVAQAKVKERSPGNRIRANVTTRMDARPVPLWGTVSTDAESPKGYRYPFSLEAGKGRKMADGTYSVTHYRKGPRAGRRTKGWFRGSLAAVRKEINGLLAGAAREIEGMWGR